MAMAVRALNRAGLGRGRRLGQASKWKFRPETLFAGGAPGLAYDLNDLSTLFQDSAGTTPVTAAGQPVGRILDKSGRGNHAFQATAASRPILRQSPMLGPELVSNGTFDIDTTGWVGDVNTTLSVESGRLRVTRTGSSNPRASVAIINLVIGRTYSITTDLIRGPALGSNIYLRASLSSNLADTSYLNKAHTSSTFQSTAEFTAVAATMHIGAVAETSSTGQYFEIDNISVREITGYYTDRNYLEFDGVDDFLQTNSIDFSSTDKVSVFAGLRKLSDAAAGLLVELSNTVASNNGSFNIRAPNSTTNEYAYNSRGTSAAAALSTGAYPAPHSSVITGLGNIPGDSASLRINGTQVAQSSADQGTGNYGTYPIYIGRRGGTTLPFKGHLYSLIIVGKLASDSEIRAAEKYIAQRTGVTLQ